MILAIYKPKGPTSHDIIYQLRKITGIKKIGHAGTLDPLAEGVLVVGITRAGTKQMHELVKVGKTYRAVIQLGETSTTDDAEGEKELSMQRQEPPELDEVQDVIKTFIGEIDQVPPIYSALKIDGKAAYKYAREGKSIEMKSRKAMIHAIDIIDYTWPLLTIDVSTGSGVYIRSLARDIGAQLQTGGYLASLQRTRVGDFSLEDALSLEAFEEQWKTSLSKSIEA